MFFLPLLGRVTKPECLWDAFFDHPFEYFHHCFIGREEIVWSFGKMWRNTRQAEVLMLKHSIWSRYPIVCHPYKIWWGINTCLQKEDLWLLFFTLPMFPSFNTVHGSSLDWGILFIYQKASSTWYLFIVLVVSRWIEISCFPENAWTIVLHLCFGEL